MPYIGTFAAARIQADGRVFDLWQSQVSGQSNEDARELGVGPWVTSVTVQVQGESFANVSISMEAPYADGVRLLESGLFQIQNLISVRLGYPSQGLMTPWYTAILGNPSVQIGPQGMSITLSGQGSGAQMMLSRSARTFSNMTKWDVVRQIVEGDHKMRIYDRSGAAETILSEVKLDNPLCQANDNDWMFLRTKICEPEGVFLSGSNDPSGKAAIVLSEVQNAFAATPKRTYVVMGGIDISKNQYPVYSFATTTPQPGMFTVAAMKGARITQLGDDGEVVEADTTPDDLPEQTAGEGTTSVGEDATEEDAETGLPNDVPPDKGGSDDQAAGVQPIDTDNGRADVHLRKGQMGVPGTEINITVPGQPFVEFLEMFELRGATRIFNGPYAVQRYAHTVTTGGFDTQITGRRNGLPRREEKKASNPNTSKPEETGEMGDG